jgi:protein-tyrosine phosphatase
VVYELAMVVREDYLQAAYAAAEAAYGSRDAYLRDGHGLDDATLKRLRERLLA